ncbi:MAG: M23 family metallopeptidase [Nocardioides sp.]|nr:M23 family metallopeptidase [Nocardioides sp.]
MIEILQRQAIRLLLVGAALCALFVVADLVFDSLGPAGTVAFNVGLALVVLGVVFVYLLPGRGRDAPPRVVQCPVRGRWVAINSPASKVPSHGIRAYGQSHAVDLVHEPLTGMRRPAFATGSGMARPTDFPAYGEPVHAMVDGTVVRVRDGQRDHRSRTRWWSVAFLMIEGSLRELCGSGGVIGNRVIIDAGDGVYALVAHLQQGSAAVAEGDRVAAGDVIGRCGNTGNTTEPHVHAQLMDRSTPSTARGLAMGFEDIRLGSSGEPRTGMPANGEHLVG